MNILLAAHNLTFGDGQGRINLEIVKRASAIGHRVTLLADRVEPTLLNDSARWISICPRLRKPNLLKVRSFLRKANRVAITERKNYDIIVGNGNSLTIPHDVNLCQFVHGAWGRSSVHISKLRRGPYAWYQRLYTTQNTIGERNAYLACRFVVAPSDKIAVDLKSVEIPSDRIRVIYNGVDLQEFHPGASNRHNLGLPSGPLAIFAGDIRTPRKNLDSVLHALTRVKSLRLAVIGNTANSPFPALANSLGIADRVHFLGFRKDINQFMRAGDMFVFPSRYEAGSLVILEALASGLPVISASSAGGAELVTAQAGVVLDDSEDVDGLAAAMKLLVDQPERRSAMSLAARAIAEQHSWTQMADEYLALFEEARLEATRR